jgi:protein phosphatase 2C family protein 2/3
VSRTFGDIEAKLVKYGGNPNVVIAEPEIQMIKIDSSCDYIILACDGIFEKLTNPECVEICWDAINSNSEKSIHEMIS